MALDAVITLFEHIFYPEEMCGTCSCRAGADLLKRLTGQDFYDELCSFYVPGAEELTVCAALADRISDPDPRLVRKTAAVMAASGVQVSPYEDAREVFSFFQAIGIPRGLVVDGPAHTQRMVSGHLKTDRVFHYRVYTEDFSGEVPWIDAVYYMSLLLDHPLSRTALICSSEEHAHALEDRFGGVYCVERSRGRPAKEGVLFGSGRHTVIRNLYDLPEAMGIVASSDDEDCAEFS